MRNRDMTILIVLATVVYMILHYYSLFQYFFHKSTIVPALVENSDVLVLIVSLWLILCTNFGLFYQYYDPYSC